MCSNSRIQASVNKRDSGKNVQRILFRDKPGDSWCMRGGIPKCTEQPFNNVRQAALFIPLTIRTQGVKCQAGMSSLSNCKRLVHKRRAITSQTRAKPEFFTNTLDCFEYGVKVVIH